jgi:hypothetical protein
MDFEVYIRNRAVSCSPSVDAETARAEQKMLHSGREDLHLWSLPPIVSMVVYVVVKSRSQTDGFGLMGADDFL